MAEWFECKVKYLAPNDQGLIKPVTALSLVDALSFTEAEAKVIDSFKAENNRELTVLAIKRSNIREVVPYGDTANFHKVKVTYSVQEEESEKAKKVVHWLLVNADDPQQATERTNEHLKEMLVPYTVESATLTKFVEILEHDPASGLRKLLRDGNIEMTITHNGEETTV